MASASTGLNPLFPGPWMDPLTGKPTETFFWFMNQLLNTVAGLESAQNSSVFTAPSAEVSQLNLRIASLEKALAFVNRATTQNLQIAVCTQATFPVLGRLQPKTFIYVSDYAHLIFWDGSASHFADGGNNFTSLFENDPPGPGWHLVDGSAVNYLNADGTVTPIILEDLTASAGDAAYLKAGSPNSGPNAAVAPTFTGGSFDPAGTVASTFTGTPAGSTHMVVDAGADDVVAAPYTPAGTVASTFTGTPADVTGTNGTDGEPRNLVRRPFFRQ